MSIRFFQVLWLATVLGAIGMFIGGMGSGGEFILVLVFSAILLAAGLAIVYIATGSAGFPEEKKSNNTTAAPTQKK